MISLNNKFYELNKFHVWPPASGISSGLGFEGPLPTTLAFGTDDLYSGILVTAFRSEDMNEEIRIENGKGLTAKQIIINDGTSVEITVIDDRSVTFPGTGKTVTLLSPLPNGAGATSITFIVVNNSWNGARKQPGERTLLCKKYTLIAPVDM
jgi:hypothetical protein